MGWSVEVHERQKLAEAAAARRPRRSQPAAPRPVEAGVWHVSAGAKTVTVLAAAVLAGLWARHSNSRQQRQASSAPAKSLLGRLGDAVATRLQALGIPDWLEAARGRGASGRSRKQRKPRPKPAARAAGDAALQRSAQGAMPQGLGSDAAAPAQQRQQDASAAAQASDRAAAGAEQTPGAAAASGAASSNASQPETQSSGGSVSSGAASPQHDAKFLDAAPEPAAMHPPAQPAQQRGGQRKKKGKGKKKK